MRSVFIHIAKANIGEVKTFLSEQFSGEQPWIYPAPPEDNVLFIDFTYPESEDLPEIYKKLEMKPEVSLVVDVSGRHSGEIEVMHFVDLCLNNFIGVAQDDYTNHAWSLIEIKSEYKHQGRKFFDYAGWHEENKQKITDK